MNLVLSLTEQCNLRCTYCYYKESHAERAKVMGDSVLEAAIQLALERTVAFRQNFLNITFFGGEPLLRFDAVKHGVEVAKKLVLGIGLKDFRLHFAVNTNGTLLNDEIIDFLQRENFQIFLSLDGNETRHNICRKRVNGEGSFAKIAPHIPKLVKMNVIVLAVVTRENISGLCESIRWLFDQGFKRLTSAPDFDGHWTEEALDALGVEYQKLADLWVELKKSKSPLYLGTIQDKVKIAVEDSRYRSYSCLVYEGGISVATDGSIFPCTRFIASNPAAPYCQGNVFTGVDEARAKEVHDFVHRDKKDCEGCSLKWRCTAHECACTSFYTTGTLDGVSVEVCAHERMLAAICDEAVDKLLKA